MTYNEWHDREFKNKIRLKQETFNVILEIFFAQIELTPTNLKPNPTSTYRQLALIIYRLGQT